VTTTTWRAELPYIKTAREPQVLSYVVKPQEAPQARFRNRVVAKPDVDLRDYRVRAVIDWLDVTVTLRERTQFQHLQKPVLERTGMLPFIAPVEKVPGGATTIFRIRFQEARLAMVLHCLDEIRQTYGFVEEPRIAGMEISVDFTPRVASERARHRMFGVLARHLFPKVDIVANPYDRPRFKWGRGKSRTRYLIGDRNRLSDGLDLLRWPLADLAAPVDATFYVGRQHGRSQWKVMDKILDQQNLTAGTRVLLPEGSRRARVEVTLNEEELSDLKIGTMDGLRRFRFATLQGRYFQFMLPTFATRSDRLSKAVVEFWESNRRRRFMTAGIVGLIIMDHATAGFRAVRRREVVRRLGMMRRQVKAPTRAGTGSAGAFVAYEELNRQVSRQLEKLGERESRGAIVGKGMHKVGRVSEALS